MLNQSSRSSVSKAASKKSSSLKTLAKSDPEILGFLRAIKETGLREKAVELLNREIQAKKSH